MQDFGRSMETKSWVWRRKPSEKIIINLNEQLSSARNEADAKDNLVEKQAKAAEEALAGWEKAEAEAASLKQEFDVVLLQKSIAEEKVISIDAALKECLQQLHDLKDEHQRIIDATLKMSQKQETMRTLEEMLADKNKMLHRLTTENNHLCSILDMKQNLIKDLIASKSQSEADFAAIVERLDLSEKNNESLKYEIHMLQKELELRNQERQLNLKATEATQKQHIGNVRKINRLESECQRLRVIIRKRLPSPAAIAKMRGEVEMLGNSETRRKSNSVNYPYLPHDTLSKQPNRYHAIEEENKSLKETLARKNSELQFSRVMFAQTASKLSQCEKQLQDLLKGPARLELARSSSVTYEPVASVHEVGGNEDNVSCAESWASALISQLEQFRNGKSVSPLLASGSSDLTLTSDFGEMEKLSIICVHTPENGSFSMSGEDSNSLIPKTLDLKEEPLESTGKELVAVDHFFVDFGEFTHGHKSNFIPHDGRVGFGESENSVEGGLSVPLLGDNTHLRPYHSSLGSAGGASDMKNVHQYMTKNQQLQLNLYQSLRRIIELTEEVIQRVNPDCSWQQLLSLNDQEADPWHKPVSPGGQTALMFLWESSELSVVLKRFIAVCNDMLDRKADAEKFVAELASTLRWIIDHCFSFTDVTEMEKDVKQRFSSEFSCCVNCNAVEVNNAKGVNHKRGVLNKFKVKLVGFKYELESTLRDENRKLMKEIINMGIAKKDVEEKLNSMNDMNHSLVTQFQESEKIICNLQTELTTLKSSRAMEGHIVNQNLVIQDLGTQLSAGFVAPNENQQKFFSTEDSDQKSNCCEELDALESHEKEKYDLVSGEKELRTSREISAASEKLAECQETILKLGKQLKALASPNEAALFDKVFSSPAAVRTSQSPRSLDLLLAMENAKFENLNSPQTKEIICREAQDFQPNAPLKKADAVFLNHLRHASQAESPNRPQEKGAPCKQKWGTEVGTLVVVPKKQKGRLSFLRTLLSRKRKDGNKKLVLPSNSLNTCD